MSSSVPPAAVLGWFDVHRRDLPWREPGRSGWEILVSEIMLQQTQVSTVLGYYERFLSRFPDVAALAAAGAGAAAAGVAFK